MVDNVMDKLLAKHGAHSAVKLDEGIADSEIKESIPTGIAVLDHYLCAIGGLPVGRIVELYSEEAMGKSSLVYHFLGCAQREGGRSVLLDSEQSFDRERAAVFGVDPAKLIVCQPSTIEDALGMAETVLTAIEPGVGPNLIAWDSLAASPPQAELTDDMDKEHPGKRAILINKGVRKVLKLCVQKRACFVVVNQVRFKIGVMFGDPMTTPGGQAIKHAASLRLKFTGRKLVEGEDGPDAMDVKVAVAKTRLSVPARWAMLRLDFAAGWNDEWSTLTHGKEQGVIPARAHGKKAHADACAALGWPVLKETP